jgi:hypothetical protein
VADLRSHTISITPGLKSVPKAPSNEAAVAARGACEQAGHLLNQSFVEFTPLAKHELSEAIGEALEPLRETSLASLQPSWIAHGNSQT